MKKLSMSVVAFGILSGFGDGARRFLEKKKEDARASPLRYTKKYQKLMKEGELGTDFYDELYSKAWCYNTLGEYQKAYDLYMDIASKLRETHYDEEAEMAETQAKEIKLKIK